MKTLNVVTSTCRCCRYYNPEGRRGGACQQLGVTVRGCWKACSLAIPAFAPSWETLEGIEVMPAEPLRLGEAAAKNCSLNCDRRHQHEEKSAPSPELMKATPVLAK